MEKDKLILKWLDNDLTDQEHQAFKSFEDSNELVMLDNRLQNFKAKAYDTEEELNKLLSSIKNKKAKRKTFNWIKPFLQVAAVVAVCFSLYYYINGQDTSINTQYAEKTSIQLPDASRVSLNAKTLITYNKKDWKQNREVKLKGEAFFKVAKGSSFKVKTTQGTVTVYGTQFNVKQRDNYFEVVCYEGLVGVTHNKKETKLKPGNSFLIVNGEIILKEKEERITPSWLNNTSVFKSLPLYTVISELERQYGVDIKLVNIDSKQIFTGSFTHNNLDLALKSITFPLQASFSKSSKTITMIGE